MKIEEIRFNLPIPIGKIEGKWWVFLENYEGSIKVDGLWENFKFIKGALTDLGSIPARLQGIVNPGTCDPLALFLYLCHDNGYASQIRSRRWYDILLSEGLNIQGIAEYDFWDGLLVKIAVRGFGGKPWKKKGVNDDLYHHDTMQPRPLYRVETMYIRGLDYPLDKDKKAFK